MTNGKFIGRYANPQVLVGVINRRATHAQRALERLGLIDGHREGLSQHLPDSSLSLRGIPQITPGKEIARGGNSQIRIAHMTYPDGTDKDLVIKATQLENSRTRKIRSMIERGGTLGAASRSTISKLEALIDYETIQPAARSLWIPCLRKGKDVFPETLGWKMYEVDGVLSFGAFQLFKEFTSYALEREIVYVLDEFKRKRMDLKSSVADNIERLYVGSFAKKTAADAKAVLRLIDAGCIHPDEKPHNRLGRVSDDGSDYEFVEGDFGEITLNKELMERLSDGERESFNRSMSTLTAEEIRELGSGGNISPLYVTPTYLESWSRLFVNQDPSAELELRIGFTAGDFAPIFASALLDGVYGLVGMIQDAGKKMGVHRASNMVRRHYLDVVVGDDERAHHPALSQAYAHVIQKGLYRGFDMAVIEEGFATAVLEEIIYESESLLQRYPLPEGLVYDPRSNPHQSPVVQRDEGMLTVSPSMITEEMQTQRVSVDRVPRVIVNAPDLPSDEDIREILNRRISRTYVAREEPKSRLYVLAERTMDRLSRVFGKLGYS